jgi:hypothetical protein
MKSHVHGWLAVTIAIGSMFMLLGEKAEESENTLMTEFDATVVRVQTGQTPGERVQAAKHLFELTKGKRSKQFADASIIRVASLLDDNVDPVRYWVARCLGNFGRRAKMTVPKLRQVLSEVQCMIGDMTSETGIRFALEQIGEKAPEPDCSSH